jgi:hypothetical protein
MPLTNGFRSRAVAAALVATVLAAVSSPAMADTVWTISSGANAKPFPRPNVKIERMQGDALLFRSVSQDRAAEPRPIKEIWRVQVDDEPALNAAETAFVESKWDDAVDGYQKSIGASRKDWVKQYATLRLLSAAKQSGKFTAATAGFIALVQRDPATAARVKPDVPKDKNADLPPAINAVKAALADTRLKAAQKNTLQAFLVELYIANGQLEEAEALGGQVAKAAPAGRDRAGDAAANKGQVELKLQLALASLKQKKYKETIAAIDSISADLTDPGQQAEAMFCLAEARAGEAGDDPAALKAAAMAYMRVVAHFKNQAGAPHVAESLLKTGVVLEQAKLLPDALAAYEAVQDEYKDSPHAEAAAAAAARVRKAMEAAKG